MEITMWYPDNSKGRTWIQWGVGLNSVRHNTFIFTFSLFSQSRQIIVLLSKWPCFCWSGESVWSCPPKGLVVGYEKGGGRRVDSASSTSYVQQCTQPSESRLWVQWGIQSWGTPGLYSLSLCLRLYLEILGWRCPGSCSLQMISWSLLLLLRNVLNMSRHGRRDWNPRVFM